VNILYVDNDAENLRVLSQFFSNENWCEAEILNFWPGNTRVFDLIITSEAFLYNVLKIKNLPVILISKSNLEGLPNNVINLIEPLSLCTLKKILMFLEEKISYKETNIICAENSYENLENQTSILNFAANSEGIIKMGKILDMFSENLFIKKEIIEKIKLVLQEITSVLIKDYRSITTQITLDGKKIVLQTPLVDQIPFFAAEHADMVTKSRDITQITWAIS